MWEHWSASCLPILADAAIKGTVVLVLAWLLVLCMRRTSAAPRHAVWLVAMVCLLLLPLLSTMMPAWNVLPAWCNLSVENGVAVPEEVPPSEVPDPGSDGRGDQPVWASELTTADGLDGAPIADRPIASSLPPMRDLSVDEHPTVKPEAGSHESQSWPVHASSAAPAPPTGTGTVASPREILHLLAPWIAAVWVAGAVTVLAVVLLAWLSLWWMERHGKRIADGACVELLQQTAREFGVRRKLSLIESNRCSVPLAVGILRARLILPEDFSSWSADRRKVVMLHEVGHVARWDCLTKIIVQAASALYWFNPLVWLVLKRIQTEAERACDDLVLRGGCDACDYAEHLLQIAAGRRKGRLTTVAGLAMARPSQLEGRLLAILDPRRSRSRLTLLGVLVIGAAMAGTAAVIASIQASEAEPDVPVSARASNPAEEASASAELIESIRGHNTLWLDPDYEGADHLDYAFHLANHTAVQRFTFDELPKGNFRRGVSLWMGLDQVLHSSDRYKGQLRFEGTWHGRSVAVVDFLGPAVRLSHGNGILKKWFGYSSSSANSMTVVFDKPTWRPLVSIYGKEQIHFLDYAEIQPDKQAPLRIVVFGDNGRPQYDFRFQVLDDRFWLFDRSFYQEQKAAWLDAIHLDGAAPAKVVRHEPGIDAPKPKPFRLADVTDRTRFTEHRELVQEFIRRNRPWLNPSLDHLKSVEFVHAVEPGTFVERFAWRRDGASLVKAMETDEKGKWSLGRWEVTTPEPALYVGSEEAKLATRRDKEDTDFARKSLNHLMGTQCTLATLDFARNPDAFVIESVEQDEENGRIKLMLRPTVDRYHIAAGGTLHYYYDSTSARTRQQNVGRVEIELDADTKRPFHETDYWTDGALVCEADFSDYVDVGQGQAVPRKIEVHIPYSGYTVDVDYQFQWRPEGVWILEQGRSQITSENQDEPHMQIVRDVKINVPSLFLDKALADVAATREYVEAEGTQTPRALKVHAFALGTPLQTGEAKVLFTVNPDRHLVAVLESSQAESPTDVVLVGKNGEILGAASSPAGERLDFGRTEALGGAAYFGLSSLTPRASQRALIEKDSPCVPFLLDRDIVFDMPDQEDGKTRAKRVRFERTDGRLIATVELISTDHGRYFGATACVALMDADGNLLSAASKEIPLRVELSEIKSGTVAVDLGAVDPGTDRVFAAIGLARSRDWQTFGPSRWMTWIPTVKPAPFTTEQLLQAEDVGTWNIALRNLEQELHKELIPDVILDESRFFRNSEENRSPRKLLEPYATRMTELLARKDNDDAEALGLLCRLIGYARQKEQTALLKPYLEDERSPIRDGAAIGLGLLDDAAGMARLVEIVGRPDVKLPKKYTAEQRQAWESARQRANDAAIALTTIGTEEAIEALGKLAVDGTRRERDVRKSLVILLRNSQHQAAVPYLAEIVAMGDDAKGVWRLAAEALARNKEAARDVFAKCLREGDHSVVHMLSGINDDYYVPMVRELFYTSDVREQTLYQAANYLRDTDTKESLEAMRELFDTNPRPDTTEPRLRLAVALAARGDDRGFDHALRTLRELARPFDLPEDKSERRRVERSRERQDEMALDVFQRAKGLDERIVEFVQGQLESDDDFTLLAALRVVDESRKTPEPLLPVLKRLAESDNAVIAATAAQLVRRL